MERGRKIVFSEKLQQALHLHLANPQFLHALRGILHWGASALDSVAPWPEPPLGQGKQQ